jgi:predicted dehydrogenase
VVDLTRHLLGEVAEVFHVGEKFILERPLPDDPARRVPVEVDDLSILLFRLAGGGVGTIESSRVATGAQDEVRFEAHGSRGGIRFNLMQPNYLEYYDATAATAAYGGDRGFKAIESVARYDPPFVLPGAKNTIGWERFHIYSIFNFVEHVVAGRPADPDIVAGAKTQAILDAALQSSDRGCWVRVPAVAISL